MKPKEVIGTDEGGMFCITRPKLNTSGILILFLLFLALFSSGQTVASKDGKVYTSVSKPKTEAKAENTGKVYKDAKGKQYPILKSENGAYYYIRTSKKGNIYKAYLKMQ